MSISPSNSTVDALRKSVTAEFHTRNVLDNIQTKIINFFFSFQSPIVLFFCLVSVVVDGRPEPPVSSYLPPSYSTTQQDSFSPPPTSLSNTYGAPSALSNSYGVPSSLSNRYLASSALSNTYGAPSAPSAPSITYGAPSAPSSTYGAAGRGAGSRSGFSTHRSGGSTSRFGGSAPSQIYAAPAQTSAIFAPSFTDGALSSTYGAPAFGGYPVSKYDASQNDLAVSII